MKNGVLRMKYVIIIFLACYMIAFSLTMRKINRERKIKVAGIINESVSYNDKLLTKMQTLDAEVRELKMQVDKINEELLSLKSNKNENLSLGWYDRDLEPMTFEKKRRVYAGVWSNSSTYLAEGVMRVCKQ